MGLGAEVPAGKLPLGSSADSSTATKASNGHLRAPGPKTARPSRPNYAKIHANPFPLSVHPLPAFIPNHPLSALRIAYLVISHCFFPPSSHTARYKACFSSETQSVHITNPVAIRALWESGFFGKGSLSRSEPRWLDQEKRRLGLLATETSEEVTKQRREERKQFKLDRARKERELIEQQLAQERERIPPTCISVGSDPAEVRSHDIDTTKTPLARAAEPDVFPSGAPYPRNALPHASPAPGEDHQDETIGDVKDMEHLQLTLEEAFFLSYSLGVLDITDERSQSLISSSRLLQLGRQHSYFPPAAVEELRPDDSFMLNYAVYHHFRSLGWVVRPGVKFAVDYLLYQRGPVFSHAEFAVLIIPAYSDSHWTRLKEKDEQMRKTKSWWWMHCANRVLNQVRKSLVFVYVEVPPPFECGEIVDIGAVLKRYKMREFTVRRWNANRSRD